MDRRLLFKLLAIAGMTLLLLVPLALIADQVRQRSRLQEDVRHSIANSAAGPQTLVGPVLAIRYRERLEPELRKEADGGPVTAVPRIVEQTLYLPPEKLEIEGETRVETRRRGIYRARLFHLDGRMAGRFLLPPQLGLAGKHEILGADATLVLGVSDPRGVDNDPEVLIGGQRHRFAAPKERPVQGDALAGARLAIPLGPIAAAGGPPLDFSFPLQLTGTERLAFAPTGEANSIRLRSDWRHPGFGGRFLPREREVSADGFTARWEISHLARNFANTLGAATAPEPEVLDISFMDPVNIYLQSERAVKYGILFIALTFAGFFLAEVLRRSPIHALQYLLVGLALALFFLLLIALSEHLAFAGSYLIASAACIGLITAYLAGALGGRRPALAFGAGLTGLYGVLYGVLLSEDNSLLMGSLLLFLALGTVMLTTRRLDWYRLAAAPAADAADAAGA